MPPSLNWDEVSHGFNAYSILKTGKDEWGINLPLIFRCFGDFKLPLYIYLTVIPVSLLGLNPLSVRLVSILSGVGLVIVGYLLGKKLTRNEKGGLFSAFLVATSPYSLFLSRVAVEANLGAFLVSLGGYFWFSWQKEDKSKFLYPTFVFWGLSLFAYNSARILVPLFLLATLLVAFKRKRLKELIGPGILLAAFVLPVAWQFLNDTGGARFFWVSLIDQGAINRIIEKRLASQLPSLLTRLIYNRPSFFLAYSVQNYFKLLSPHFWFIKGGDHYQFSLPGFGLLSITSAPFLLLGLGYLAKVRKWTWLWWFFVSLIPSAITRDSPHVLRTILILPLPMVFASLGLIKTTEFLKKRSKLKGGLLGVVFVSLILVNLFFWWQSYCNSYRVNYSWAWQYGQKEVVTFIKKEYDQYDQIVITKKYGEPHEFILFYWPWNPREYQTDSTKVWDYHANWYWVDGFGKFEFWNDWEVGEKLKARQKDKSLLLVTYPGNWTGGGELLKTIYFLDNTKSLEIIAY